MSADKIKAPILLIHGEADDDTDTSPVNSERLYAARETIETVPNEDLTWLAKHSRGVGGWECFGGTQQ